MHWLHKERAAQQQAAYYKNRLFLSLDSESSCHYSVLRISVALISCQPLHANLGFRRISAHPRFMNRRRHKFRSISESLMMLLGAVGLVVAGFAYADTGPGSRQAITESNAQQGELALLSIARLELEVPIFSGTSKKTLNRGAGLVEGTSPPGAAGNIVVSAHRDSFFRPLEDIRVGDVIELQSPDGMQRFEVGKIFITDPLDISVLEATAQPTLTLITCYPFRYVGFAPERFIVRATQIGT